MRFVFLLVTTGLTLPAQLLTITEPERRLPAYVQERLSAQDRVLFDKLMRVGLESAWSVVVSEGYPQCLSMN